MSVWRLRAAVGALSLLATAPNLACGGSTEELPAQEEPRSEPASLVGRWERVTTCEELVGALSRFGLRAVAPAILAGNGLVPGNPTDLAAKKDICEGSTPRVHGHFFTRAGVFGSLDWREEQVDEGAYRIVDDRTFRIGPNTFHYEISNGQLRIDPELTAKDKRAALANPLRFSNAGWMVAVAFPGHTWKRVPCEHWC